MDDETADQEYIHEPSIDMRTNEKSSCSLFRGLKSGSQDLKILKNSIESDLSESWKLEYLYM